MLFVNLLLGTTTFIAFVLSMLIIVSNPRKRENQTLFVFVSCIFLWLLTNLLANLSADPNVALFFARSTIIAAALIPYTLALFIETYLGKPLTWAKIIGWAIIPAIIIVLFPTSLNVVSIDAYGLNIVTGPLYYLLIFELLTYVTPALWRLYRRYRSPHSSSLQKAQMRYIFAGFIGAFVPIFILNAVAPIVTSSDIAILFGPNAIIFLAFFTSMAIIKHRLLDIRLIVARSIAYIFTLGSGVIIYSLIVFGVFATFLDTGNLVLWQQYVYLLLAVLMAFTFQPLKRFFDKMTNKIFYRDAYEPQELLDQINKVLVSTIELNTLVKSVSKLISTTLKAEYCLFGIKDNQDSGRILGANGGQISEEEITQFRAAFSTVKSKVVLTDELDEKSKLRESLRNMDSAVLIRLTQGADHSLGGLSFLLLGVKKSGNPYSTSDIRLLEIIADELVIAVQNALRFEEIQQFAATLQEKVDEATHKLRRTNEKLRQLDETKDDFISMASHQLRTPLTSVKGYVSMVLDGDAGKVSAQQKKLLEQAFTSSQRMVYLIADLLNVSRLKTGKFVIEAKPTNLAEVVESEIEQLKETAKGRGLKLEYQQPKNFPSLNLDETKIRQVIMNFSDNAIYYTPTGGTITVGLVEKPQSIEFTVADNGIGVPKSEQHHLFNKFYRAGNAKKARPDGTGLGLFMAQKVVVAQGGAIIFHSEENKGSTFGFSFPKAKLLVK